MAGANGSGTQAVALMKTPKVREMMVPFIGADPDEYERVISAVYLALTDPKTGDALQKCTPVSVVRAVSRIVQLGLEVGVTAYLIPFGDTATPVAGYQGLIQLMIASGAVRDVDPQVVREGDFFEYERGTAGYLRHREAAKGGAITHAYAIAMLPHQRSKFHVMTLEEVEEIRQKHSKQWKRGDMPAWYMKKTVVRQLAKYIPQNPKLARQLAIFDRYDEVPAEAAAKVDADAMEGAPGEIDVSDWEIESALEEVA